MNETDERVDQILRCLSRSTILLSCQTDPPQAFVCASKKFPDIEYVIIWLKIGMADVNIRTIHKIIVSSVTLIRESRLVEDVGFLEIAFQLYEGERQPTRLVRFSISVPNMESAINLTEVDLLILHPAPGIVVSWFCDVNKVPR